MPAPSIAHSLSSLVDVLHQHHLLVEVRDGTATDATITVGSLHYDSRTVQPNGMFVALRGLTVDGHTFIHAALQAGATAIIAEQDMAIESYYAATLVLVSDSRKALGALAHAWYGEPSKKMRVIGVTGTNGKTTTTFLLKALIESNGWEASSDATTENVGIIGTTGNYIGGERLPAEFTTPEAPELCALLHEMKERGATAVAMEVSSHALALDRVYGTTFAGALFTNLTQDHLDFHGTMENYAAAKQKLFAMLPCEAVAVVNGDDEWSAFMVQNTPAQTVVRVGRSSSNTFVISREELSLTATSFALSINGVAYPFQMNLVGRFNVDNAAGCIALYYLLASRHSAEHQQAPYPIIAGLQTGLKNAVSAPGRMQRVPLPNGAAAIVDYAHTPDALEKALLACRELLTASASVTAKLVCVFGCGGNRDRSKRPKMASIAARLADLVIITNDNPRKEDPNAIVADILVGIPPTCRSATSVQTDRTAAIRHALEALNAGDIALIAGKGHENYQIIGTERLHFDDLEQIEQITSYIHSSNHQPATT